MEAPTYLLVTGALAALLALMLSITPYVIFAQRVALASLWLSLAVVPFAVVLDVSALSSGGAAVDAGTIFTQVLKHARAYGAIALPCAFVASLAMNRAKAVRRR